MRHSLRAQFEFQEGIETRRVIVILKWTKCYCIKDFCRNTIGFSWVCLATDPGKRLLVLLLVVYPKLITA